MLIQKTPTGIRDFDRIIGGGLPGNQTTLIIGGPGCSKTVFALQVLVNGIREQKDQRIKMPGYTGMLRGSDKVT